MCKKIVIDGKLIENTLKATGIEAEGRSVEQESRNVLRLKRQTQLRKLRGKHERQPNRRPCRTELPQTSPTWREARGTVEVLIAHCHTVLGRRPELAAP